MSTKFDELVEAAKDQMGYFSTSQVEVERQYIHYHMEAGRIESVMRGIYRLTHFPPEENEDLMVAYLWANQERVFPCRCSRVYCFGRGNTASKSYKNPAAFKRGLEDRIKARARADGSDINRLRQL